LNSPVQILQHSEVSSLLEHVTGHSLLEQFILPSCRNSEIFIVNWMRICEAIERIRFKGCYSFCHDKVLWLFLSAKQEAICEQQH